MAGKSFSIYRTDNSVKNKFYSKMRKSLRNINTLACNSMNGKHKPIRISLIYKIIEIINSKNKKICQAKLAIVKLAERNHIFT